MAGTVPAAVSTARERRFAELGVLVVMVFWAGNFIVVKGAIGVLPPIGFTFLRYCVAAVTLLVLLRWREGAIRLPHGDIIRIALLGIVGFGCYQILWPVALQSIPAGDSALLIAATPVITAVLAMSIGADTPNPVKLAGALVSFSGVALVVAAGEGLDLRSSVVGDVLTLLAAACWAVYSVFGATVLRRHSPLVTTTWAIVAGTLFIAPFGIAQLVTTPDHRCRPAHLPRDPVLGDARGGRGQRRRPARRQAAWTDPRDGPPVPDPPARGRHGRRLPQRAHPPDPGHRRGDHPGRRRPAATRIVARPTEPPPGRRRIGVTGSPGPGRDAEAPAATGVAPPVPPLLPGEPPLAILVDYDGTVALTDVSDTVMAEHVPGIWEAEVAAYDAGRMGSRRLMELEMALIDASPTALLATAAAQPHDSGFVPFVHRAQAAGIPVEIVSDGFGFFIEPALEALGVGELPVVTARTTFLGRRASIAFPNGHPTCLVCGTCKRNRVLAHQAAGRAVVFIGDGESDRYAAGYSDVVWAKRSLERICIEAGWPFQRWTEFREIEAWLEATLAAWRADPATLPTPRAHPFFCGPEAWGDGLIDPPADAWPPSNV